MSNEFKEKLRSLGFSYKRGTSEKRPVQREDNGKVGGYHTVHWDDSQDATVFAPPVRYKVSADMGKVEDGA